MDTTVVFPSTCVDVGVLFALMDSVEITVGAEVVLKTIVAVVLLLVVIGAVEAETMDAKVVFPSTFVSAVVLFVVMDS